MRSHTFKHPDAVEQQDLQNIVALGLTAGRWLRYSSVRAEVSFTPHSRLSLFFRLLAPFINSPR